MNNNLLIMVKKWNTDDIVEISHCREGRLEYSINGAVCYLEPGDLAIARTSSVSGESYFPLRHYHGLTVRMDLNKTPQCLSCLLDDVKVQPKALAEKFCGRKGGFVARANPSVAHIFSELYSVPGTIQKGYFKVKALELLLFLSTLDLARDETERRRYSRAQAELAKAISKYMMEHKDDRVTLTTFFRAVSFVRRLHEKAFQGGLRCFRGRVYPHAKNGMGGRHMLNPPAGQSSTLPMRMDMTTEAVRQCLPQCQGRESCRVPMQTACESG